MSQFPFRVLASLSVSLRGAGKLLGFPKGAKQELAIVGT